MMLPRAATGRWIIAGSGVSEERSYQRKKNEAAALTNGTQPAKGPEAMR
jgi:hypothetical protein